MARLFSNHPPDPDGRTYNVEPPTHAERQTMIATTYIRISLLTGAVMLAISAKRTIKGKRNG
ncbi:hypothetical protein [Phormidesmis sp. 146-33]